MQPNRDYYEVLGVDRDADARTIKRAFLKKAREVHPDVSDAPDAEERFKEVNEAYSVLSDEQRRANYDRYGDPEGPAGFGGGSYVDMSDIFGGFGMGDIFSSFFGGNAAGGGGRAARTRGRDMGITLRITLAEAAAGCIKTIAYDRLAPCDDCGGTGFAEGGSVHTCERCHGRGSVVTVQRTILGSMQTQTTCPDCNGTGEVVDHPCETCNGQGRTPSRERVEVEIPAGVRSGMTITVPEKGEAGLRGDACGNLVVTIAVEQDERFQRQGDDLVCRLDVDALDAILGTTLEMPGILADEVVTVEVPAGCQHAQPITVPGMGMPSPYGTRRGDLIAVVGITVPTDLPEEDLELLRDIVERRDGEMSEGTPEDEGEGGLFGRRKRKPRPRRKGKK